MNTEEYEVMYRQEQTYWWFVSRTELLSFYLDELLRLPGEPVLLDLGCGTGANLEILRRRGHPVGLDSSRSALGFCRQRHLTGLLHGDGARLGLREGAFDLITAMDSLEHIPDDVGTLRECLRVLKPGGQMLISVPAYGFLWSEHDEALHHVRRYSGAELRNKLTLAGFEVGKVTYVLFSLFFPILLFRILQNIFKKDPYPKTSLVMLPPLVNQLLVLINRIEKWLLRWINFPFGVTIVAVARKPGGSQG
ncbi:MAG: methyltransferase domain-containing protein [Candidatus Riflebacteria bacterium]|nr:methyltransferase domain-containing protein [Candidatus Riflebacteria bacterium]